MLRYSQHREVQPPEYAALRIGPLYSDLGISQSVGYRYVRLSGSGVDFLTGNDRGRFLKDGSDFPMVTTLDLNNYLIISRHMDLEANVRISYEHYPMGTQEDYFEVDLTDEGVYGTFSSEFELSRDVRVLIYDDILYRTDYVDSRGFSDEYGGQEYEFLENAVGLDWDWSPSALDSVGLSLSRSDLVVFDDNFESQEGVFYTEVLSYQRQLAPFAVAGLLGRGNQSLYSDDTRPDVFLYGVSAFAAAQLVPTVVANGALGYQISSYRGGDSDESSSGSLSATLGVAHEFSERHSQTLEYTRSQSEAFLGGIDIRDAVDYRLMWREGLFPGDLSASFSSFKPQDGTRNGYDNWMIGLSVSRELSRHVDFDFTTRYTIRSNDGVTETAQADADSPDLFADYQTFTIGCGLGARLTRKTRFRAYAEHADRTSDNEDLAYTRDVIGASLTWTHKF